MGPGLERSLDSNTALPVFGASGASVFLGLRGVWCGVSGIAGSISFDANDALPVLDGSG